MDKKEKMHKVGLIKDHCKKEKISALAISNGTSLNLASVQKILDGSIKFPRRQTILEIEDYFNRKNARERISGEEILANAIMGKIAPYLDEILMRLKTIQTELDKQKQFL